MGIGGGIVMAKKHIISYSGGLASFFEAKLAIDKYEKENCQLVFCDTNTEDEDLYRFLNDTEKYLDKKIVRLKDGRDIWDCAFQDNFLYNSRIANCTVYLKMRLFKNYIKQFNPEDIVIHIGFDFTELHRLERTKKHYNSKVESLISATTLTKQNMMSELDKLDIEIPRLYKMGFAHNNCGGFCFKAGIGHFKQLYLKLPKLYDYHMNKEQELIKQIGQDVSILKRVRNGAKTNLTLKDLKDEFVREGTQLDMFEDMDIGGCDCFVSYDFKEEE